MKVSYTFLRGITYRTLVHTESICNKQALVLNVDKPRMSFRIKML